LLKQFFHFVFEALLKNLLMPDNNLPKQSFTNFRGHNNFVFYSRPVLPIIYLKVPMPSTIFNPSGIGFYSIAIRDFNGDI
jgi:hypothetical protein